ncbi:hypothetical protein [Synoicihabitans lomoniglobus]|uniref:Transaldolase n=1 Tax=Synoicihabitans lomoniglobus TaxID=2909285 RepID=A0AAE9ZXP6_9BACT|nr:hypothetical protein [Opitutaceae bacterium LMO-M01]WED65054.1 hypothetical protein PXH66_22115 [Opitutaceae bacterium LMO-M01]
MKLWLASTEPDRVARWSDTGLFTGVLTNPATLAAAGCPAAQTLADLCAATEAPVFYQLEDGPVDQMKREATAMLDGGMRNLGIKVAVTPPGLAVLGWLRQERIALRLATAVTGVVPLLLAAELDVPWVTPAGSALEKQGGPTKLALLTEMQKALDCQGATTTLIPSLGSPGEMAALAMAGVRAGFMWDTAVESFLDSNLVRETVSNFDDAWAKLHALTVDDV